MSRLDDLLAGRHLIRSSLNLDAPAPAVERVDFEAVAANVRQQQLDDKVTAIKLANAPEVESEVDPRVDSLNRWLVGQKATLGDMKSIHEVFDSYKSIKAIYEAVRMLNPDLWQCDGNFIDSDSFEKRFWRGYSNSIDYSRARGQRKII